MSTISIERQTIQGIPTLAFIPDQAHARSDLTTAKSDLSHGRSDLATARPLVFFFHGFTDSKESALAIGYHLAENGLVCLAPDAPLHGERLDAPLDDLGSLSRRYIYPQGTGFDTYFVMLECALRSARELNTLIDHFAADPRVDTRCVGVTGFSMGGFASYLAAAENPRIRAAAPMGAYPDLKRRWHDLILEATAYPQWTEAMDALGDENARRAAWLAEIDPASRLLRDYRRPLLMVNGDQDTDSPKAYAVPFYGEMRPRYQAMPEALRLWIVDGVAHQLTGEMIAGVTGWFRTHLLDKSCCQD